MSKKKAEGVAHGRSGPPTKYPNKVRVSLPVQLDKERMEQMAKDLDRLAKSGCPVKRSDYISRLIELHGATVAPW